MTNLTANTKSPNTTTAAGTPWLWECLAWLVGGVCVFMITTNAAPLSEVFDLEITKKFSVKSLRISVLVLFAFFVLFRWRKPNQFAQLSLTRGVSYLVEQRLRTCLWALFLTYVATMSVVSFSRHWALETRAFDLGIFVQAIWNTLQGDFLYSSIKGGINLMGDHVSPILLVLTPVYSIWPDPKSILLAQVFMAALTLFPLAYIAHEKLKDSYVTAMVGLMYVFYLPTRNALHEDFHPEVLVEPLLVIAFILLERRKLVGFIASLLVIITAKENMCGIAFMFGFYALVFKQLRAMGLAIMICSVALFFFEIKWLVPYLSGKVYLYDGNYFYLFESGVVGLLTQLFDPDRLEYIFKVFLPFLFIPFVHLPTLILAAPVFMQNYLSANDVMRSFGYHYTTGMTPFIFISMIYGLHTLSQKMNWNTAVLRRVVLAVLFVALMRSGPSEYYFLNQIQSHTNDHVEAIADELAAIPQDVSVLTHNNFIPQVINRKHVFQFEYLGSPTKTEQAVAYDVDYVIFDQSFWEPGTVSLRQEREALNAAGYQEVKSMNGFHIYRKK